MLPIELYNQDSLDKSISIVVVRRSLLRMIHSDGVVSAGYITIMLVLLLLLWSWHLITTMDIVVLRLICVGRIKGTIPVAIVTTLLVRLRGRLSSRRKRPLTSINRIDNVIILLLILRLILMSINLRNVTKVWAQKIVRTVLVRVWLHLRAWVEITYISGLNDWTRG